ncbi:MAG: nucleotidyltransferase substrate binding protein [Candidatus Nomurabacteria bacterium]|jgi:nucleotidyltransferase substrate binding protein (TIGR01987 family)|nr:nucleotidyltransferase substrate binding protein [Candidatus Nomurabacteria bacterium]
MKPEINAQSLERARDALRQAIGDYDEQERLNPKLLFSLRSGVIQNYEVAYELARKAIDRWLAFNFSENVDAMSRQEIYASAFSHNLIDDPKLWYTFHLARNNTSHNYDNATATDAFAVSRIFLPELENLISKLQGGNNAQN